MSATTWNTVDKSGGTTLSSTNHVAASTSGNNGARGNTAKNAGKWYFEFPTIASTSNGVLGISNKTYDYGSTSGDSTNFAGIDYGGNPAGFSNPGFAAPNGHNVSFAVDMDNKKYWVRYDGGGWNNDTNTANQNPATNTGGFAINAAIANAFIVCRMQNTGSVAMNAGDTAFAYTLPSGFLAWNTPPTSTWSTTDKNSGTTLSNTNHTAASSSGNNGVRGNTMQSAGKWYFEFPTIAATSNGVLGISNTTYDYGSTSGDSTNFAGIDYGGNPAGFSNPGFTAPNGHNVSFAVDMDNKKYWLRYDGGGWNNDTNTANQNPATNTGGFALNAAIVNAYIVGRMQNTGSVTVNAGDTSFAYAAPSGFTAWNGAPATPAGTWASTEAPDVFSASGTVPVQPTWSPTDKNSGTTLSNTNHTAASTSGNNGARSTNSRSTGQWYFEFPTIAATSNGVLGIADASYDYGSTSPDTVNFSGIDYGGTPNTFVNPGFGAPNGHNVSFAVDMTNKKYWVRYDGGGWNNDILANQNPATNTGGYAINSALAAAYIVCRMQNTGSVTVNEGDSAFVYPAPPGFAPWMGYTGDNGPWASTEAPDTFSAHGYPGAFGVLGNLLSTEAPDTFAGAGYQPVNGFLRSSEAPDTFSAYGRLPLSGHWASTEAPDHFAGTGIGRGEDGTWLSSEAPDVFAFTGTVPISGQFASTEAPDRFVALGAGVTRTQKRVSFFVT